MNISNIFKPPFALSISYEHLEQYQQNIEPQLVNPYKKQVFIKFKSRSDDTMTAILES